MGAPLYLASGKPPRETLSVGIDWTERTTEVSASASDSDDSAKWHFEYCYCPLFMSSGITEVYVEKKMDSRGKFLIFKFGNDLFKFISLRSEHEMHRQYFICVKLCKETGGLVHVCKVHISNNVIRWGWAALCLLSCSMYSSSVSLDMFF